MAAGREISLVYVLPVVVTVDIDLEKVVSVIELNSSIELHPTMLETHEYVHASAAQKKEDALRSLAITIAERAEWPIWEME